jgi:hypothetical protein
MTVSFNFEKSRGLPYALPAAHPSITLSHGIDNTLEQACVQHINNVFMTEYLPAPRECLFGWSSVEIPASMKKVRLSFTQGSSFHESEIE